MSFGVESARELTLGSGLMRVKQGKGSKGPYGHPLPALDLTYSVYNSVNSFR